MTIRVLLAGWPGILHTNALTVTGRTLGENVYRVELTGRLRDNGDQRQRGGSAEVVNPPLW
jgi:hypothetical protein